MQPSLLRIARSPLRMVGAAAVTVLPLASAFSLATAAHAQDAQNKLALGHKVYMEARCFACHGEYGYGGAGPRFRDDRYLALASYVIGQILLGREIMPPYGQVLDNQQIAAVASYIRNSWGNDFGDVRPAQVAQARDDVNAHPPQGAQQPPPFSAPGASGNKK